MIEKKEKGMVVVNLLLVILIVLCVAIIGLVLIGDNAWNIIDPENVAGVDDNIINRKPSVPSVINTTTNDTRVDLNLGNQVTNGEDLTEYNEASKYYYNQLNGTPKSMYNTIIQNIDKLKRGTESITFELTANGANREFQSAWDALLLDRPDIFWIDTSKIILVTRTTTFIGSVRYKYTLQPQEGSTYYMSSFNSEKDVNNAINEISDVVSQIVQKCNSGDTYQKVKNAHDAIVSRMEYDQTNSVNNSNIYGAFVEKKAVCEGYAESFKIIMDKLNIPCVIVYGQGVDGSGNTEAHAWNFVKMDDGVWYAVDCTWDDPIIIGNGWVSPASRYRYFLKGSNSFSGTHIANGDVSGTGQNFSYPQLSESDYNR